jgi:hypothetical protein
VSILFKECARWSAEIKDLWKRVRKEVGWRRARWKPIAKLFREEKAEEAVVEFIRRTGVGKRSGTAREPIAEEELTESEG